MSKQATPPAAVEAAVAHALADELRTRLHARLDALGLALDTPEVLAHGGAPVPDPPPDPDEGGGAELVERRSGGVIDTTGRGRRTRRTVRAESTSQARVLAPEKRLLLLDAWLRSVRHHVVPGVGPDLQELPRLHVELDA